MKEIKKCLMIMLAFVSIIAMASGCGKEKYNSTFPDSDDWRDMQIIMHGVRIKGAENMILDDLYDLGFKKDLIATFLVNGNWVEPGEYTYVSLIAKDGSIGNYDILVKNYSDKKVSVDNCEIEGIYVLSPNPRLSVIPASDVYLANGIGLGNTSEEVRSIMGAPTSEDFMENGNSLGFYHVMRYKIDKDKGGRIEFAFDADEKIITIIFYF